MPALPPEALLNPDGTLRLEEGVSGVLDLEDWSVQLDPKRGPVLRPQEASASNSSSGGGWHPLGGGPYLYGALDDSVLAIAVSGTNVYVGGLFTNAGDTPANYIARWDASTNTWHPLGTGVNDVVYAIAVSGTDVYVGGRFTQAGGITANRIARWDASTNTWHPLGTGQNNGVDGPMFAAVYAIAVSGTNVYVGGDFTQAGGNPANHIARWDASTNTWHPLGTGVNDVVYAIAVSGTNVYVGGWFTQAGGITANYIARWDVSANIWHPLGTGVNDVVYAIAVSGTNVYVGGRFTLAGGNFANRIARWDASTNTWHPLGTGQNNGVDGPMFAAVYAIAVSGTNVYVGGRFTLAGGNFANHIARWDGITWSPIVSGTHNGVNWSVSAIAVSGTNVYVGGGFTDAGGNPHVDYIARLDVNTWHPLGARLGGAIDNWVFAIAVSGTSVYVGGRFTDAGGNPYADYIARWDASTNTWHPLGSGVKDPFWTAVFAIAVSGTNVYVGGWFTEAGGNPALNIARWDASTNTWHPLGTGVNGLVRAIAVSGTTVYVGGDFTDAGGNPNADYIARWDGTTWHPLGTGVNNLVHAIAVSGTDVYVGGRFTQAGGITANRIARWDVSTNTWYPLGTGVNGPVYAIAVSGTNVYVGGWFTQAGGNPALDIARWDASTNTWYPLGTGVNGLVRAIAVSGTTVYVGGDFTQAGGNPANHIARWDGNAWYPLGTGVNGTVHAITVSGTDAYVGGEFTNAGDNPFADYIARWSELWRVWRVYLPLVFRNYTP